MLEPVQYVWMGVALLLGATLQGAIGFAFGMLAIPIMVWAGVPVEMAVVVLLVMGVVQTSGNLWRLRAHIEFRATVPLAVFRILSLPLGLWVLSLLADAGKDTAKQAVGVMIGLALLIQWLGKVKPREPLHPVWTPIAGVFSGTMSGAVGMGGPPLVMWVMAHNWEPRRARVFLWVCFLQLMPVQIALMLVFFFEQTAAAIPTALAFTPVVLVGAMVGGHLGGKLSKQRLRAAAMAVLALIAVTSIVEPWL